MNQPGPEPAHSIQVPPENLGALHLSLAANLSKAGLSNEQINSVLSTHVTAECIACRLKLSGEDLGLLAVSQDQPDPKNSKLARVRLGYCGRDGCKARLYHVLFAEHESVDWKAILAAAEKNGPPQATPETPVVPVPSKPHASKLAFRIGLAVAAFLALIYVVRLYTGGRIPLIQPKHTYAIAPETIQDWSRIGATNATASTNAPKTVAPKR
jgi:hypothetical protein